MYARSSEHALGCSKRAVFSLGCTPCALGVRVIALEGARGIFLKQEHIYVIVEECVLTLIVTILLFNR